VEIAQGLIRLEAGLTYELCVQHHHKGTFDVDPGQFEISASSESVAVVDPRKTLDSPYDEKRIRFKTAHPAEREYGTFSASMTRNRQVRVQGSAAPSENKLEGRDQFSITAEPLRDESFYFELPYDVTTSRGWSLIQVLILGILLAAPHILRVVTDAWITTVAALLASWAAAYIAVFNLRKGL
jgi:hypothetical protein